MTDTTIKPEAVSQADAAANVPLMVQVARCQLSWITEGRDIHPHRLAQLNICLDYLERNASFLSAIKPVSGDFAALAHAANHITGFATHDDSCDVNIVSSDVCDCGYRKAMKELRDILEKAESSPKQEAV